MKNLKKHCPFCGCTDAEVIDVSNGYPWVNHPVWEVGCPTCGFWVQGESEEEVTEAWNRRYPHEYLPLPKSEKPIPKKKVSELNYWDKWNCPTCGDDLYSIHQHFCPNCGQALNWEGVKE